MEPSRILHLNHVAYIGGAEVALINLLSDIDRERYLPVIMSPQGELQRIARDELRLRCATIPTLPGLNRYTLPRVFARFPLLLYKIATERPDLIYANTNFAALYSGVIGKCLKIPSLAHIRDIEPLGLMARTLIRQNTRLIAISQAVERYLLEERMSPRQITCVYDGVDMRQYQPQAQRKATDGATIGIIGQLGERKGHLVLLEAMRELVRENTRVKLLIVGKEPAHSAERYTERLQAFVRQHHLEQQIEFLGFRRDVPELLAQIDMLALPSLQEPFGKIVIEAMAMERPVVASRVGGVPEIVVDGETGLLVPPRDPAALKHALARLIADAALRERMGKAGRQRVEACFTLERNVQATQAIYSELFRSPEQISSNWET